MPLGELTEQQKHQVDVTPGSISEVACKLGLPRQYVQDYIRGKNLARAQREEEEDSSLAPIVTAAIADVFDTSFDSPSTDTLSDSMPTSDSDFSGFDGGSSGGGGASGDY